MIHQEKFQTQTKGHRSLKDVTAAVAEIVHRSEIQTGTVHIFNVGSTACLGAIEFESGLERDLPEMLDRLIPPSLEYGHEAAWHDGNGHSHLQATLMGPALTVPITQGQLVLGTWQQICLLECDIQPRSRTLVVTVSGEK